MPRLERICKLFNVFSYQTNTFCLLFTAFSGTLRAQLVWERAFRKSISDQPHKYVGIFRAKQETFS